MGVLSTLVISTVAACAVFASYMAMCKAIDDISPPPCRRAKPAHVSEAAAAQEKATQAPVLQAAAAHEHEPIAESSSAYEPTEELSTAQEPIGELVDAPVPAAQPATGPVPSSDIETQHDAVVQVDEEAAHNAEDAIFSTIASDVERAQAQTPPTAVVHQDVPTIPTTAEGDVASLTRSLPAVAEMPALRTPLESASNDPRVASAPTDAIAISNDALKWRYFNKLCSAYSTTHSERFNAFAIFGFLIAANNGRPFDLLCHPDDVVHIVAHAIRSSNACCRVMDHWYPQYKWLVDFGVSSKGNINWTARDVQEELSNYRCPETKEAVTNTTTDAKSGSDSTATV